MGVVGCVCLHAKGSAGPLTIARGPNLVLWQHAILTLKLGGGRDGHGQDDEELAEHGSCDPVCGVSVLGLTRRTASKCVGDLRVQGTVRIKHNTAGPPKRPDKLKLIRGGLYCKPDSGEAMQNNKPVRNKQTKTST